MNRADGPPNDFEAGKPGTGARDRAEASIEELRQGGGLFVNAVRATRMPMALTDPNLPGNPIVFANEAFLKLSGYRMDEVLGQQPHFMNGRLTDPQDAARFAEALRGDQDDIIETVQYRKDGSKFVATVLLSAFKDGEGHTLNHFMSWLDVTRRVDAEDEVASLQTTQSELRERDTRLRLLIDSWAQAVWETDPEGVVVKDSPSWRAYTGQTLDEWLGYGWLDAIHPDDRAFAERQWREAMASKSLVNAEFRMRTADGAWRWTNVRAAPVLDDAGRIEKWAGMNIDIDARKRAEEALRENEEKYRSLFESIDEGFTIMEAVRDDAGRVVDVIYRQANQAWARLFGFELEIGRKASELFSYSADAPWIETWNQVLETGEPIREEQHIASTDRWYNVRFSRIGGAGSDLIAAVFDDVTERRRVEALLRESEGRQSFLLKLSDDYRAKPDEESVGRTCVEAVAKHMNVDRCYITEMSDELNRGFIGPEYRSPGLPPVSGEHSYDDYPDAARRFKNHEPMISSNVDNDPRLSETDKASIGGGLGLQAIYNAFLYRGESDTIWALTVGTREPRAWTNDEQQLVQEVAERTWAAIERARADNEVREREADLARVQRTGGVGGLDIDVAGGLTSRRSPEYLRLHGLPADLGDETHDQWRERVHPDDRQAAEKRLFDALNGDGDSFENEYRIIRPSDGEVRWISARADIERDANGKAVRLLGAHVDITEQKRASEALRESEARLAAAFESVPAGLAALDLDGRAVIANAEFRRFLPNAVMPPRDPEHINRWKGWTDDGQLLDPQDYPSARALRGESVVPGQEMLYTDDEGHEIWTNVATAPTYDGEGHVTGVVSVISDISMRKQAERALRDSERRLADELASAETVQSLSSQLIKEGTANDFYEQILEAGMAVMHADFGSMQMLDRARNELQLIAWRNFHPDAAEFWHSVSVATGTACGAALEHGQRVVIEDLATDAHMRGSTSLPYYEMSGIRSVQSTPLTTREGRVIGMISTHWREPHVPQESELRLFDILARQAADFIERASAEQALRDSERHARTLLEELQHRVRNILAMVRSMIGRASFNKTSVPDFVDHLQGRISAMARTQAILTRSPGEDVDLEQILRDEMLADAARDGKIRLQGPPISLSPKAAEALTLAIHELSTNSLKYGALADGGRVLVSWTVGDADGEDWLDMRWEESGVPIHDLTPALGFGTELITMRIPYELGGTSVMTFNPDGLEARIQFPLRAGASVLQTDGGAIRQETSE